MVIIYWDRVNKAVLFSFETAFLFLNMLTSDRLQVVDGVGSI